MRTSSRVSRIVRLAIGVLAPLMALVVFQLALDGALAAPTSGVVQRNRFGDQLFQTRGAAKVFIDSPTDGSTLTTLDLPTYVIAGTANSNQPIEAVSVTLDGQTWHQAVGTETWTYDWALPEADERSYTITAMTVDRNGQSDSEQVHIIVDTIAPTATAPLDEGEWSLNSTILFTWTESSDDGGIAGYHVRVTDDQGLTTTDSINALSYTFPGAEEGRTYSAAVAAEDNNGNVGPYGPASDGITPDWTPPSIAAPGFDVGSSPYFCVSGLTLFYTSTMEVTQTFAVTGTAADGVSDLDRATLSEAFGWMPPPDNSPEGFRGGYPVAPGEVGEGSIAVTIYDNAGNTQVQTYSYTMDGDAPHGGSLTIEDGATYVTHTQVTLELFAEDSGCGMGRMCISNDGICEPNELVPYNTTRSWSLDDLDGSQMVYVWFSDGLGNTSGSHVDDVFLDRQAPEVTVQVPDYVTHPTVTIRWEGVDPQPSSGNVVYDGHYRYGDGAWENWFTNQSYTSSQFIGELGRTYVFSITARDAAGNSGQGSGTTSFVRQIYLPMVLSRYAPFVNSSFEQGLSGWIAVENALPVSIVSDIRDANPAHGESALLLGNPLYSCGAVPIGHAAAEQLFAVPENAAALTFKYLIWTQDASPDDGYDQFEVYINDQRVFEDGNERNEGLSCDTWRRVPGPDNPRDGVTSGWATGSIPLAAYQGELVTLSFRNYSRYDNWYNTYTYVDDVRFETSN